MTGREKFLASQSNVAQAMPHSAGKAEGRQRQAGAVGAPAQTEGCTAAQSLVRVGYYGSRSLALEIGQVYFL